MAEVRRITNEILGVKGLKRLYSSEKAGWKCCINHFLNLMEDPS